MARGRGRPRRRTLSPEARANVKSNLSRGGTKTGKRFVPLSSTKTQRTLKSGRGFSKPSSSGRRTSQTFKAISGGKGTTGFFSGSGQSRSFGGAPKVHKLTKDTRKSSTRVVGRFTGILDTGSKSIRKGRTFVNIGQKGFAQSNQPLKSVSRASAEQSQTQRPIVQQMGFNPGSAISNVFDIIQDTSNKSAARKQELKAAGKLPAQQPKGKPLFDIDDVFGRFL